MPRSVPVPVSVSVTVPVSVPVTVSVTVSVSVTVAVSVAGTGAGTGAGEGAGAVGGAGPSVALAICVLKLTRLNRSVVAVNPDHISWVDAAPDTTLCLIGGDKLLVRESLDELIDRLVAYRQLIRSSPSAAFAEGDIPPAEALRSIRKYDTSSYPPSGRKEG